MDAPSIPRVARPVGRRAVAAPVVAVAVQRAVPVTAPPVPEADQEGDDPSLDFTTRAAPAESQVADELGADPGLDVHTEPDPVAEPPAPTAPAAPKPAPVATTAANPANNPNSPPPASGLRTLIVLRNGVIDYDDSTVQVLDMDNLTGAGAHDLADALIALKGADRSTTKDTAFTELMAMFNTAIS